MLGELVEDVSVLGAIARREQIRGMCQRPGCWRRCELDLERLVENGFGQAPLAWAKQTLVCPNMDGCKLQFKAEYGRVLRLQDLHQPGVKVRFHCMGCGGQLLKAPRDVAGRLRAKAKAELAFRDIDTVAQLRAMPMAPCRTCKKTLWRVEVRWPERAVKLSAEVKAHIAAQRR